MLPIRRVFWYVGYVWGRLLSSADGVVRRYGGGYSVRFEGEFIQIASAKSASREELTNLAGAMRLSHMSSVILGLNDALVEFTGAGRFTLR